jgi:hypothetical protein
MVTREGQLARVPRLIVPVLGGSRLSETATTARVASETA